MQRPFNHKTHPHQLSQLMDHPVLLYDGKREQKKKKKKRKKEA